MADLLYVACHEGYPGHLAELVLKEERLAKGSDTYELDDGEENVG